MALTTTGLYPREASAMADAWKDSWFKEQGVRVLYVLPRAWTDRTLPMTAQLERIKQGDTQATTEARQILKGLGRFAEPALNRAIDAANSKLRRAQPVAGVVESRIKI